MSSSDLFVRNLPFDVTDDELLNIFSDIVPVKRAFLIRDRYLLALLSNFARGKKEGPHRGFGFVQFALAVDAEKALSALNGTKIRDRKICVDFAKAAEKIDPGSNRKSKPATAPPDVLPTPKQLEQPKTSQQAQEQTKDQSLGAVEQTTTTSTNSTRPPKNLRNALKVQGSLLEPVSANAVEAFSPKELVAPGRKTPASVVQQTSDRKQTPAGATVVATKPIQPVVTKKAQATRYGLWGVGLCRAGSLVILRQIRMQIASLSEICRSKRQRRTSKLH